METISKRAAKRAAHKARVCRAIDKREIGRALSATDVVARQYSKLALFARDTYSVRSN